MGTAVIIGASVLMAYVVVVGVFALFMMGADSTTDEIDRQIMDAIAHTPKRGAE